TAIVIADLLGGRNLGGDLRALLGGCLLFLFLDRAAAARGRARGRSRLIFLVAARGFFFGMLAREFLLRLARVFLGLASGGGFTLVCKFFLFDGAMARIFLGALAGFDFIDARIGKGCAAACLLFSSSVN